MERETNRDKQPRPPEAAERLRLRPIIRQSDQMCSTKIAMPEPQVPLWKRAAGPLRRQAARFPFERTLVMGVAAVIGLYGGIAAGLFATAISSVQLLLFRGGEVASSLFGTGHATWARSFRASLAAARW